MEPAYYPSKKLLYAGFNFLQQTPLSFQPIFPLETLEVPSRCKMFRTNCTAAAAWLLLQLHADWGLKPCLPSRAVLGSLREDSHFQPACSAHKDPKHHHKEDNVINAETVQPDMPQLQHQLYTLAVTEVNAQWWKELSKSQHFHCFSISQIDMNREQLVKATGSSPWKTPGISDIYSLLLEKSKNTTNSSAHQSSIATEENKRRIKERNQKMHCCFVRSYKNNALILLTMPYFCTCPDFRPGQAPPPQPALTSHLLDKASAGW